MARITVNLLSDEKSALWQLAEREHRDPRDQAALIIHAELERRGLLGMTGQQGESSALLSPESTVLVLTMPANS